MCGRYEHNPETGELEREWLEVDDDDEITDLLMPGRDGTLEMYPVSTSVNSVRNNYEGLSNPV